MLQSFLVSSLHNIFFSEKGLLKKPSKVRRQKSKFGERCDIVEVLLSKTAKDAEGIYACVLKIPCQLQDVSKFVTIKKEQVKFSFA